MAVVIVTSTTMATTTIVHPPTALHHHLHDNHTGGLKPHDLVITWRPLLDPLSVHIFAAGVVELGTSSSSSSSTSSTTKRCSSRLPPQLPEEQAVVTNHQSHDHQDRDHKTTKTVIEEPDEG